jgi:hypothetical protein
MILTRSESKGECVSEASELHMPAVSAISAQSTDKREEQACAIRVLLTDRQPLIRKEEK